MAGPPPRPADHQVDFLRFWLPIIGVRELDVVRVEHAWEGATSPAVAAAIDDVRGRAAGFRPRRPVGPCRGGGPRPGGPQWPP